MPRSVNRALNPRSGALTGETIRSRLGESASRRKVEAVNDDRKAVEAPAPVERRVAALEQAFEQRNLIPGGFVEEFTRTAEEDWVPANGAKVVARAWADADFRRHLLENGKAAVAELGFSLPEHHRHLVVLENTPSVQNVICCIWKDWGCRRRIAAVPVSRRRGAQSSRARRADIQRPLQDRRSLATSSG